MPWGPTPQSVKSFTGKLINSSAFKSYQKSVASERSKKNIKSSLRLLSVELTSEPTITAKSKATVPKLYIAKYYDYNRNCSLIVKGNQGQPNPTEIVESKRQPLPNNEEFDEAVQILKEKEPDLNDAIRNEILKPYRPMPPLYLQENPEGDIERTLCVGLRPLKGNKIASEARDSKNHHEIVAVNMIGKSVIRFDRRAPSNSSAEDTFCGSPSADQQTADRGTPGSAKITISRGKDLLWDFIATRPAASSGTNGSGIELQYVNYKEKRVLRRANVPILNVEYDGDACGPYRDWQYEESWIEADGKDVAPGFRLCLSSAKTILDTENDHGNFLGVAVYVEGNEEVVTCKRIGSRMVSLQK